MKQSHIAMRNSAAGFVSQAISMGLNIILVPFVIHRIGGEAYGIFLLAISVVTILDVLRNPVALTVTLTVARAHEKGELERMNRGIGAAILFCLIPAVGGFLIMAAGCEPLYRFFEIDPSLHAEALAVLVLAGAVTLLTFPLFPVQGVLWGLQRHDIAYLASAAFQIVRAAGIVLVFLFLWRSVVVVMLMAVVAEVGTQGLLVLFARKISPGFRIRLRGLTREDFQPLLTFGTFMLLTSVLSVLNAQSSRWIVGKALGLDFVTYLWVATMVVQLAYRLVMQVTVVLMPIAARYHTRQEPDMLVQMIHRGSRYSLVLATATMAALLPQMDVFLRLWMGQDYVWLAPYGIVLGGVTIITASSSASFQVLQGMGNARSPFLAMLASTVGGLAVMVLGVTVVDLGFAAIIAGLCVEQFIRWSVLTWMAMKHARGSWGALAWGAYGQPLLAGISAVAAVLALKWLIVPESWAMLLLMLTAGVVVFGLAFIPFLTQAEWGLIRAGLDWARRKVACGGT